MEFMCSLIKMTKRVKSHLNFDFFTKDCGTFKMSFKSIDLNKDSENDKQFGELLHPFLYVNLQQKYLARIHEILNLMEK